MTGGDRGEGIDHRGGILDHSSIRDESTRKKMR